MVPSGAGPPIAGAEPFDDMEELLQQQLHSGLSPQQASQATLLQLSLREQDSERTTEAVDELLEKEKRDAGSVTTEEVERTAATTIGTNPALSRRSQSDQNPSVISQD